MFYNNKQHILSKLTQEKSLHYKNLCSKNTNDIFSENINNSKTIIKHQQTNHIINDNADVLPQSNNISSKYSKSYIYKINDVVITDEINYDNEDVFICIYNVIINDIYNPMLLYLLYKDPESNILYFPTTKCNLKMINNTLDVLFQNSSSIPIYKGYKDIHGTKYLFYQNIDEIKITHQKYNDLWWWTSIHEIINTNKILNFSIDSSVTVIFEKLTPLLNLFDKQNRKLIIPFIGYYGNYYTYINFIAMFGANKSTPFASCGPYYYFTNYIDSARSAIWSSTKNPLYVNNELLTINDYGLYKKGCIVLFALFTNNTKYFLNKEDDSDDESEITKRLSINDEYIQKSLKIRDTDGKWSHSYDSAFIGTSNINIVKNNKERNYRINSQHVIKKYNQQFPLSYHYVNTDLYKNIPATDLENFNIE